MEKRINNYYKFNTDLTNISTDKLNKLIKDGKIGKGYGINAIIKVNNSKIFVKSIPVTQKEYDNSFDTRNLYNLPTYRM